MYYENIHDDVIKWKHFPRYWPFVRGIHRSPVNSPHKGQWRGASMFSFIYVWINDRVNNREAGDWRHHHAHYDDTVMFFIWRKRPILLYNRYRSCPKSKLFKLNQPNEARRNEWHLALTFTSCKLYIFPQISPWFTHNWWWSNCNTFAYIW